MKCRIFWVETPYSLVQVDCYRTARRFDPEVLIFRLKRKFIIKFSGFPHPLQEILVAPIIMLRPFYARGKDSRYFLCTHWPQSLSELGTGERNRSSLEN
jgi:hypothetical protein